MSDTPDSAFSFDQFSEWHRTHAERFLKPALNAVTQALSSYFDDELTESQRVRVRVLPGRIKVVGRTWHKLNQERYRSGITTLDSVPTVIDDLIGTRIICTNTSDLERVWELLQALPTWVDGMEPVLALQAGSAKDYCGSPKATGYRARHLNVRTSVNHRLARSTITCEIQVRTLLQDSWGELTHEDTYKPGSRVQPFVVTLARRMADMLAILDEIAEDLRSELDRADVVQVGESESTGVTTVDAEPAVDSLASAARAYLQRRMSELNRPIDLATLAWEMQREFGQEIAADWLRCGTFKNLLRKMVPTARITTTPPSYVLPDDYRPSSDPGSETPPHTWHDMPTPVVFLKSFDRSLPTNLSPSEWQEVFGVISAAAAMFPPATQFDLRLVNELTRTARDQSKSDGVPLARGAIDYVAKGVWYSGALSPGVTAEEIGEAYLGAILTRVREAKGQVSSVSKRELRQWLGLEGLTSPRPIPQR